MMEAYKTIKAASEGFFKDRGSKFYAFAFPVVDIESVKSQIDGLKAKYHDARHHCFAYIIGLGANTKVRANDDGEPNHSAGDPILGQIKSYELTNTLVVVVRYFGGTKLGVSGLINAYREATREALSNAPVVTEYIRAKFELTYTYEQTNEVQRLLSEFSVEILHQEFTDKCWLKAQMAPEKITEFQIKSDRVAGCSFEPL